MSLHEVYIKVRVENRKCMLFKTSMEQVIKLNINHVDVPDDHHRHERQLLSLALFVGFDDLNLGKDGIDFIYFQVPNVHFRH